MSILRSASRLVGVACIGGIAACGSEPPLPKPVPPPIRAVTPRVPTPPGPAPVEAFPVGVGEPRFKRVLSKRMRLSIPLPQRSGWKMVKERSSFLTLDHTATQSRLVVSIWREDETMNRQRCEERARLLRELPTRGESFAERFVDVPKGFDTRVDAGFVGEEGAPLDGWLLAFGGLGRECFAFVYTTRAEGDDAEKVLGDRLALLQTLTLEGIERRDTPPIERVPSDR